MFLNAIGVTVYSTLRDLLAPFADIVAALKAHYEPKSLVIVERFHFHKRGQTPGESIAEYVAAKCAFPNSGRSTSRSLCVWPQERSSA